MLQWSNPNTRFIMLIELTDWKHAAVIRKAGDTREIILPWQHGRETTPVQKDSSAGQMRTFLTSVCHPIEPICYVFRVIFTLLLLNLSVRTCVCVYRCLLQLWEAVFIWLWQNPFDIRWMDSFLQPACVLCTKEQSLLCIVHTHILCFMFLLQRDIKPAESSVIPAFPPWNE